MTKPRATRYSRLRQTRLLTLATVIVLLFLPGCGEAPLEPWLKQPLSGEFSVSKLDDVDSFDAYRKLEDELFARLDEKIYGQTETGAGHTLMRYSSGSAADPRGRQPDWNRSVELPAETPVGGVLLLHGMSDSPYSLRSLGESLNRRGFQVLAPRLPGHGTIPAGLTRVSWQDMAAVVQLGVEHLAAGLGNKPIHIIGYSTGAALALDYALQVDPSGGQPVPDSLVLISPAIGVSPAAALAKWKRRLSLLPGLGRLAWLSIEPEFDPYKYNSFATNAAEQVRSVTRSVTARIAARKNADKPQPLPPMLVLKSTVDATVSNAAVVDRLMKQLSPHRHELVMFDINRFAVTAPLLVANLDPITPGLMKDASLPFALTVIGNRSPEDRAVIARHKPALSSEVGRAEPLGMEWPAGVISLSHVALPFSMNDPLYGRYPPADKDQLFLGQIPLQGERGVLQLSSDYLLRLRYNPFYDYLENRVLQWLGSP